MCNFRVGQKVVFIGDDPGFDSEPGKTIHIVKGIRQSCCCVEIDVGISLSAKGARGIRCRTCGKIEHTDVWWKQSKSFRPLITDYSESEIAEVDISPLTRELELETV